MQINSLFEYRDGQIYSKIHGRIVGFSNRGYVYIKYGRRDLPAHRVVWALHGGNYTDLVDHINGIKSDNRIENLRLVTVQQNSYNRPKQCNSRSQYKGVYWESGRRCWAVRIGLHSAAVAVGRFTNELAAALAYDRAVREWAGEYAVLNFGSII